MKKPLMPRPAVPCRPVYQRPSYQNGDYKGKIVWLDVREMDSSFNSSGKREVLSLMINIDNEEGALFYSPTISWSRRSKFYGLLLDLNCLPEEGHPPDLDKLLNMPVIVTIENNEAGDVNYSNIVRLLPR